MKTNDYRFNLELQNALEVALLYGALKQAAPDPEVDPTYRERLLSRLELLARYTVASEAACELRAKYEAQYCSDPDIL